MGSVKNLGHIGFKKSIESLLRNDWENQDRMRSLVIDYELKKEAKEKRKDRHVRIIVLGSGDSGKTTLLRQLNLVFGTGFSIEQLQYKSLILENIANAFKGIFTGKLDYKKFPVMSQYESQIKTILGFQYEPPLTNLPAAVLCAIVEIWNIPSIKEIYCNPPPGLDIHEMGIHFLNDIARITHPDYLPTNQDILYIRKPTMMISEHIFQITDTFYHFFDVAGQRECRARWQPYFDGTLDGIIFAASLISYCQVLAEDPRVNRHFDALVLFESIANHTLLKHTNLIILFTKSDLLSKRLDKFPVNRYLGYYTDGNDFKSVVAFFKTKMIKKVKRTDRLILTHVTNNTDTKLMTKVVNSITACVIQRKINLLC